MGLGIGNQGLEISKTPKSEPRIPNLRRYKKMEAIREIFNISNWPTCQVWYHFLGREIPFHWWIPLYFYFTGLSAGTFVVSSLSTVFGLKQFKPLAFPACIMAIVLLAIAPICLALDLEHITRFLYVLWPPFFNWTSPISWGAYLMFLYPVICVVYAVKLFSKNEKSLKIWGTITVILALSVHAYTGFFFGVVKARAYWHTALMPGYFLTSAILSGLALLILVIYARGKEEEMGLISSIKAMITFIIKIDLFWAFSWIVILLNSGADGKSSAIHTLSDPLWTIGEVILGMLVPLFILYHSSLSKKKEWIIASSVLIIIGVCIMRFNLVSTGFKIPLM